MPTSDFRTGDVDELWAEMRDAAGDRDVWIVGGGDLVGQFADAGLLDEMRVSVAPVTLVSGTPAAPPAHRIRPPEARIREAGGQFAELVYSVRAADVETAPSGVTAR